MTDYSSYQGRLNHNSILVQDTHREHVNHNYLDIGMSLLSSESSSLFPCTAQTGVKSMAGKFLYFLTFQNLILGSSKTQSRHIPSLYQLRSTLSVASLGRPLPHKVLIIRSILQWTLMLVKSKPLQVLRLGGRCKPKQPA